MSERSTEEVIRPEACMRRKKIVKKGKIYSQK